MSNTRPNPHRGITLIVVMLILVVITILGIGGAQIALLGERSTRYDRDYLIASQGAEAALKDAEFDIGGPNFPNLGGTRAASFSRSGLVNVAATNGACGSTLANLGICLPPVSVPGVPVKPVWATVNFLATGNGVAYATYGQFSNRPTFVSGTQGIQPALPPRYIIEAVVDKTPQGSATGPVNYMYRITAVGFGPRQEVQVVMQTAYIKP